MSKRNDCWGIEVGASALKAIRLAATADSVKLLEHDVLPFKQVLTTPDIDVNESIQVNLDQFLQRPDVRKSAVWVSVPGHMGFARFAKLPPVEPKKIGDIVKFEAVQQIPFPIDQVEWDYRVFQQQDSPDVEVGIFAIGKERVNQFLENYKAVGLGVDGLTLSPLAVFNAVHFDLEMQPSPDGTVIVDIGTSNTDVMVTNGDSVWLRTLSIGGNDFTEALVKSFKLSFAKAEKLKREAATSKYAKQIFQAMRPVFADLVQELQRSLGYYQSLNRDATLKRLIGVGSTFRLPGLQKFLRQQLQMDVTRLDSLRRINLEGKDAADFEQHALNMATAYGLALQGLGMEQVGANILPQQVIRQRLWHSKQPWFAGAAALVVVAVGWNVFTLMNARASYDDSGFAAAQRAVQKAREYQQQAEDLVKAAGARDQIESVRKLLEGKAIVPLVLQDVQLAAASVNPQPETLAADYGKLAAIPRDQRRRVYVESVTLEYKTGATAQGQSSASNVSEEWKANPWAGSEGSDKAAPQGPAFLVNVKGTTPYREGVGFFTETFISWLRKNAERPDRPYRIVLQGNPMVMFARNQDGGAADARASQNDLYGGAQPGAFNESGGLPGAAGMPGATGMPAAQADLSALLPARPLSQETRTADWRFEVQWTVVLLPPNASAPPEGSPPNPPDTDSAADQAALPPQSPSTPATPRERAS